MKPGVGGPTDEYRAVCVCTGSKGDQPECGERATVHLMVESVAWGVVGLAACGAHEAIGRRSGTLLAEHEHGGLCGLPGTLWHLELNRCVIDDSGREPEMVAVRYPATTALTFEVTSE